MPLSLSMEPTTSCNLRCPECPSGLRSFSRPTGMLSLKSYEGIIDELAPTLLYLNLYFQGEPYLNPDFFDMVKYAHSKNIYTSTSTNAHYLDPENALKTVRSGLDRLILSLDGVNQAEYETYRVGGQIEKVLTGIKELENAKKKLSSKTPYTILQFLLFQHNEDHKHEVEKIGKELGVDKIVFKTAQVYDFEKGSELIPREGKYSRYEENGDGSWHIKNKLFDHCWKMWHSSVVTWDGKVVPCCFDKDAKYVLGDAGSGFEKVWRSDEYNQFRDSLLTARKEIDICRNCTEGTSVMI